MKRLLAVGVLAVLASAGVARAQTGSVAVRAVEPRAFPDVEVTISVNGTSVLSQRDVRVIENGIPVRVQGLETLGDTGERVDAVLAIDVSNSMRGAQLTTALAAANAFVANVPATLPVGVLAFAATPTVVSPVSEDRTSVRAAVASLESRTTQGTALFDAVVAAAGMFDDEGQHNVVLLTDGRDTGGAADLEEAINAADDAGVNLFTIALDGGDVDQPTLDALASRTGGRSASITPDDLTAAYTDLAREFGQQYVLTYRSKAPFSAAAELEIVTPFGTGTSRFLTPAIPRAVPGGSDRGERPFVTSDLGVIVVTGLVFLATANAVLFVRAEVRRRRREAQPRSRLVAEATTGVPQRLERDAATALLPSAVSDAFERTAERAGVLESLALRLHQAGWRLRPAEFLALSAFAGVAGGGMGFATIGPVAVLSAIPAALVPILVLGSAASKRLSKIQAQLADTLLVIASSLRAGHSFLQALDTVTKEIDEPARSEFGQVMSEVRFGREVDDALDALVQRTGSKDLEWTVTAISIQRKVGGNLAEVLESVAKTIRERETLRRQVRVLSAEGRISALVLTVLPVFIAAYLVTVNPDYLRVLTSTRVGVVLLSAAAGLMVAGYLWMQRIVKIDDI